MKNFENLVGVHTHTHTGNLKNIKKQQRQKGITLIVLVITIVILLILSGITIATLTGENGLFARAKEAKEKSNYGQAEEKVKLAVMGAMSDDGKITVEELIKEIKYYKGTLIGTELPVDVKISGYTFIVDENGKIKSKDEQEDNGTLGTVTGTEQTNTIVKDKLGNQVVVPSGFKIMNPTETVPDGIIVEDVDETRHTVGSQFVWIPVGEVIKKDKTKVTINLSRYTFDKTGKETSQGDNPIAVGNGNFQELVVSAKTNMIAKDISRFKSKTMENKGYYIGRYEARDGITTRARVEETSDTNQLVCTPDSYIYTWTTQIESAELSRNMYNDSNFSSDLINSYALDTAIVFLQKFDNRIDKTKPYSMEDSVNTDSLAERGTNMLTDITKQDKICNIYDMASNATEWTTETYNNSKSPCAVRGCNYLMKDCYMSTRYARTDSEDSFRTFRPILYLET